MPHEITPVTYLERRSTVADVNPLVRRWLLVMAIVVVMALATAILTLVGLRELRQDTLRNRDVGRGNRVVTCNAVALADRAVAERLPECAGIDLP